MIAQMAGISIIRIPNTSEKDPSEPDIRNLLSLSKEKFEHQIVFEQKFDDTNATVAKDIQKQHSESIITNIFYNFLFQLKISLALLQERDRIDVTLWHVGGFTLILPIVISRVLGHQVIVCVLAETVKGYLNDDFWDYKGSWGMKSVRKYGIAALVGAVETFSFVISTQIFTFSDNITEYLTLRWFEDKTQTVMFNYQDIPSTKPIETRDYSIVYLGRICELKGADRVSEAIQILDDEYTLNEPALFIGDGYMRTELESKLESHNVKFTGWLPRESALDLIANSKLLVLPSRSEGLPKALLEAMARGTVPIVSSVGDIPDVVSNGTNGILLEHPSPEPLARAILEALENDQSSISDEAAKTIQDRFSYQSVKKDFESAVDTS